MDAAGGFPQGDNTMNEEPKKENKAEAAVVGQASFLLTKEQ